MRNSSSFSFANLLKYLLAFIMGIAVTMLLRTPDPLPQNPGTAQKAQQLTTDKKLPSQDKETYAPEFGYESDKKQLPALNTKPARQNATVENLQTQAEIRQEIAQKETSQQTTPAFDNNPQTTPPPPQGTVDENLLADWNLDSNTVSAFRERLDNIDSERSMLSDKATLEESNHSAEYQESLHNLNQQKRAIRQEMPEDSYDRSLYASGKPNRLLIASVTPNSPAQLAGLSRGDIIYKYNGSRVFDWLDLSINPGQENSLLSVPMEVWRENTIIHTFVPVGPIGILTNAMMMNPEEQP